VLAPFLTFDSLCTVRGTCQILRQKYHLFTRERFVLTSRIVFCYNLWLLEPNSSSEQHQVLQLFHETCSNVEILPFPTTCVHGEEVFLAHVRILDLEFQDDNNLIRHYFGEQYHDRVFQPHNSHKTSWSLLNVFLHSLDFADLAYEQTEAFCWLCFSLVLAYGVRDGLQMLLYVWVHFHSAQNSQFDFKVYLFGKIVYFIIREMLHANLWGDDWDNRTLATFTIRPTSSDLLMRRGMDPRRPTATVPPDLIISVRAFENVREELRKALDVAT